MALDRPGSGGAPRAPRADALRNRELVLAAAREVFAESGWQVPLDVIATRAGVGPGTVYRHFRTKDALFQAVVEDRVTRLVAAARRAEGAADPGAAFFTFLDLLASEARSKRDIPDALAVPGALQQALHQAFGTLLARAQEAGAVRAEVTGPDVLALLKSLVEGLQDADPGRVARLTAVVRDGLRPPSG